VRIQVLFFEGCPNSEKTVELVSEIARVEGVETLIERVEIRTPADAVHHRFLGSPSVRVNGLDVEAHARNRSDFAMVCRLYGASGLPPSDAIVDAIRKATLE
jgi:hypothetical protein